MNQQELRRLARITDQNVREEYCVIYNQSGTNLAAALVTADEFSTVRELLFRGSVVHSKTYYHYPKTEQEAISSEF